MTAPRNTGLGVEQPDHDDARRLAQGRRIAKERRQAEREKRAGWIAAEDILKDAGNPNALMRALKSGAVDSLFIDPARWWLKPWTVPQHIWESAQFKNGKLWRNGICLEGPHQKFVINKQQWGEFAKPHTSAQSADVPPPATDTATNPVELSPPSAEHPSQSAVGTPAPVKKRATKRAKPKAYAEHQHAHLASSTGEYASREDDEAWAKANGYSGRHVRNVLRANFFNGLPQTERAKFRKSGKQKSGPPRR
jgi:hypothetical protein